MADSRNTRRIPVSMFGDVRAIMMGIAILMVVTYHSSIRMDMLSPSKWILTVGWAAICEVLDSAVDIFFFFSAFGLYYSLNKDRNLKHFYKKRAMRILPEYILVYTIWSISQIPGLTIRGYLEGLFFIDFYRDGSLGFWYIGFLIPMYLVYPLIHRLVSELNWKKFAVLLLAFVFLPVAVFHLSADGSGLRELCSIAFARIPVFLLGAWAARMAEEKRNLPGWTAILAGAVLIAAYAVQFTHAVTWEYPLLMRYSITLFGLGLGYLLCLLFYRFRLPFLAGLFTLLGTYSLEMYLIHERVWRMMLDKFMAFSGDPFRILYFALIFCVTFILAVMLKQSQSAVEKGFAQSEKNWTERNERLKSRSL